ncbi:MAG: GNAT family N-acetyltransferase [Burkholderiales bacterium]|nr:GNAT family N-acetyltransferase [Burkholderiales bacterium]
MPVVDDRAKSELFDLCRLEEVSQNASRPERGVMIDGWSVGLSAGVAKRSRAINAFYPSHRPFAVNLADAREAYRAAGLPCVFRLTPFVSDPELDARLAALGYIRFDSALVMARVLAPNDAPSPPAACGDVRMAQEADLARAAARVASLRGDGEAEMRGLAARWLMSATHIDARFAFPSLSAAGEDAAHRVCIASAVGIRDGEYVGLFEVATAAAWRGRGIAEALLRTHLDCAQAQGARVAYLQVATDNPARRLYERLGFQAVYEYWYRALPDDVAPRAAARSHA